MASDDSEAETSDEEVDKQPSKKKKVVHDTKVITPKMINEWSKGLRVSVSYNFVQSVTLLENPLLNRAPVRFLRNFQIGDSKTRPPSHIT